MREFFKPWRRKVGVMTLMLACVATAFWLRSQWHAECIWLTLNGKQLWLKSQNGGIHFLRTTILDRQFAPPDWMWSWWSVKLSPREDTCKDTDGSPTKAGPWVDHKVEWKREWFGFHLGAGIIAVQRCEICIVPFWAIVTPLTLLSAWLLLSKPRPTKQAEPAPTTEPDHA